MDTNEEAAPAVAIEEASGGPAIPEAKLEEPAPVPPKPQAPRDLFQLAEFLQRELYVEVPGVLYDKQRPVVRMRQPLKGEWTQLGKSFPLIVNYLTTANRPHDPAEDRRIDEEGEAYQRTMLMAAVNGMRVVIDGVPARLPDGTWNPDCFVPIRLVENEAAIETPGVDMPYTLFDQGDRAVKCFATLVDDFNNGGITRLFERVSFHA